MFSQKAEKTTPRIQKKIVHFFSRIMVSFIRRGSKSFISGQQKRHSLPFPHTKRARKKILNSDNAFTGRLLNSSFPGGRFDGTLKRKRISCLYHRKAVPAFTINSRFETVIMFDYEHVEYMTRHLPCSRLEHMRRQ